MKEEILTRYYVGLLIVAFVTLVFFVGIFKAILLALLITIVKYLFDKYIMSKLNPFIDKIIEWIKSKITTTTTTTIAATTTTTTDIVVYNYYEATLYTCGTCVYESFASIKSTYDLTIGKFYISDNGYVYQITGTTIAGVIEITNNVAYDTCEEATC